MILQLDAKNNLSYEEDVHKLIAANKIISDIRSSLVDKDNDIKEITYSLQARSKRANFEDLIKALNKLKGVKKVSLLTPETNLFI